MARQLNFSDPGFSDAFATFCKQDRGGKEDVAATVRDIIKKIQGDGFDAVAEFTQRFDRFSLNADNVFVSKQEIEQAEAQCDPHGLDALNIAANRIRAYHEKQLPEALTYTDEMGVTLGWRWMPVDSAGLYAPGGLAAYPSSVLMNAIPAVVAGVDRLVLATPTPDGEINPLVLAAARIAGVSEIMRVGGAQAIAALAHGAEPITPVDVIVGPGNAYVAEAKRQVFGTVGIDSLAGPSEILVVADGQANPEWIAADLLSQAEHDPTSQSILITESIALGVKVEDAIQKQLAESPRRQIAGAAWRDYSAIIIVPSLEAAPALVNAIAPEHLELAIDDPQTLLPKIKHAGAIFMGKHTPEAIGDYIAGPNHVLPTSRTARYASGLSVLNFMKRTSIIGCNQRSLEKIGPAAATLADQEGLPSHAHSVRVRLK